MQSRHPGFTLIELMIVISVIAVIASIAVPNLLSGRLRANESAAISTLKSIASAQAQCRAANAIDTNANGAGEFGYFGELAGTIGLRTGAGAPGTALLSPPVLSAAFGSVRSVAGITGGVVLRSGYVFRMLLPAADNSAVPESPTGGVGSTAPNPLRSETLWCCYAWPSSFNASGRRVFFVNQSGDVYMTSNLSQRYSGNIRVPSPYAAYAKGAGNLLASTIAANTSGVDDQLWLVVQ